MGMKRSLEVAVGKSISELATESNLLIDIKVTSLKPELSGWVVDEFILVQLFEDDLNFSLLSGSADETAWIEHPRMEGNYYAKWKLLLCKRLGRLRA